MSQSICRRIRDQINLLRDQPHLPFSDLLDADLVGEVLGEEGVHYRERIFSPLVTLWTFLTQVLSLDHCCRKAVACLIAYRTARGQDPCSADSGSYCKARQRLPIGVITGLVHRTAQALEERVPEDWLWKRRETLMVDGSTVSMPDTPENQQAFPQARTQASGVGFPIARVVAIISLATGVLRSGHRSLQGEGDRRDRSSYATSWIASKVARCCWETAVLPRISASIRWWSVGWMASSGCTSDASSTSARVDRWASKITS